MMFKVYYRCLMNFYKLVLCEYLKTHQKGGYGVCYYYTCNRNKYL